VARRVLGIDGGGSKTDAWIGEVDDRGALTVVGRAAGPPSNPRAVGFEASEKAITESIDAARRASRIEGAPIESVCLALAGAGRASEQDELRARFAAAGWTARIRFVHDGWAALASAFDDPIGVALIAGTGSLAFARDRSSREARAGGWGYWFGDEGSGFDLGRQTLRAVSRAVDGRGPATSLVQLVFEQFGIREGSQLVEVLYKAESPRGRIATLAPLVFAAADQSDGPALAILDDAAAALSEHVVALVERLAFPRVGFPLALAGGLLIHGSTLRARLLDALAARGLMPAAPFVVREPVVGALRIASREPPVGLAGDGGGADGAVP